MHYLHAMGWDALENGSDTCSDERNFVEIAYLKLRFPMRSGSTRLRGISQTLDDYANLSP